MNTEELTTEIKSITDHVATLVKSQQEAESLIDGMRLRLYSLETASKARDLIADNYMFSKIITGTTSGTGGTETTHTHKLGRDPSFVFITSQSNGVVYLTSKSTADIKVKGSVSSLNFTAYLLA